MIAYTPFFIGKHRSCLIVGIYRLRKKGSFGFIVSMIRYNGAGKRKAIGEILKKRVMAEGMGRRLWLAIADALASVENHRFQKWIDKLAEMVEDHALWFK